MRIHHRGAVLALLGLVSATLLFTSCQNISDSGESATAEATQPAEVDYTITVKQHSGTPVSDIIVKLQKDGADVSFKLTDKNGTASFQLPPDDYTILLDAPTGGKFHYDDTTLTAEEPTIILTVYQAVGDPFTLSTFSKNGGDGYVDMDAFEVGEGTTYTALDPDDHTYIVFNPTRTGYYEFTCSGGVDFGYHGMPILNYDAPRMSPDENGVITIPVEDGSIGDPSISRLVFRLNAAAGSEKTEALFTVKYAGSLIKSEEELADWTILEADPKALVPYTGDTSGTLTNVDLKAADVQVVKGEDGYYHYGGASGPVVFLRIASENPYTQSFKEMCETDRIRAYLYDENGKFLRKEGYSELILAYAEVANDAGLVPLNDQLIYVMKHAGDYMGWWDYETNSDIFGDLVFPPEIAWMFACAYYKN